MSESLSSYRVKWEVCREERKYPSKAGLLESDRGTCHGVRHRAFGMCLRETAHGEHAVGENAFGEGEQSVATRARLRNG